ncbi:MAG TPA: hypothetical protein VGF40_08945 [Thermoanaerobaculia bacterium]
MDHAVSLVQAYLQLNGYFTSAEYPVVSATNGSRRYRTITDIDILAFRFPNFPRPELEGKAVSAGGAAKPDPGLGIPEDRIDMIIGEVKEGRVNFNSSSRDPEVLATVLSRFGATRGDEQRIIEGIRARGEIAMESGYQVRLVAFGAMPPGDEVPPCRIISLGRVLQYLQNYVRVNWTMLRQCQFKDQALGFLMTLEKARRGGAGRRGQGGIEVVGVDDEAGDLPGKQRRRTDTEKGKPRKAS